jgi:DNA polymerase-3 subunit alpha
MSKWFPLHTHSHFSLLDGLAKPEQIASRIEECGHDGCALTDHGTVAGVPPFIRALKKKNRKAIAGCEFYVCRDDASVKTKDNGRLAHLCVLAKGDAGWRNLIRAASESNLPANFYRKPRLSIEQLGRFAAGEWIVFSGHMGSDLANVCFTEPRQAYRASTYDDAKAGVPRDWRDRVFREIRRYQAAFGRENFYLEIQLIDVENLPAAQLVANILRWAGKKLGVRCVATADSHYARQEDAPDQRILLCAATNDTLKDVQRRLDADEEVGLGAFFRSNRYHIPTAEEMAQNHTADELECSLEIAGRCQAPGIARPPLLPIFECPGGITPDEHLRALCEQGWQDRIASRVATANHGHYRHELDRQLDVLTGAGLSSYFLITQDIIDYAVKKLKCRIGEGRGSAAGCLVSYLIGITNVDPVRYDLLFERFYTTSRNVPAHVSFDELPFNRFSK